MLDSARLLVARRMDIEPLVRIPLPVCQEPRVWLSLPANRAEFTRPSSLRSFVPRSFSRRVLSPRKYRSQVAGTTHSGVWNLSGAISLSLSLSLSLSHSLSLSASVSVLWCWWLQDVSLTGDHVSRGEGATCLGHQGRMDLLFPFGEARGRYLLWYRKSRASRTSRKVGEVRTNDSST